MRRALTSTSPPDETDLEAVIEDVVCARLPDGWTCQQQREARLDPRSIADLVITITPPDGEAVRLMVEMKRQSTTTQVARALDQLARYTEAEPGQKDTVVGVVAGPYLSPTSRRRISERGFGYVDATGNVRIAVNRPPIFIESFGVDRNPWPKTSSISSLKGRSAGAAVRALLDFSPPYGVRELASLSGVSAPTLSRVVELLNGEGLIERSNRGPILDVNWEGALRRWVLDYSVLDTNRSSAYLAARGLDYLTDALRGSNSRYALTGSMVVPPQASIAPTRLAMAYTSDPGLLVDELDLRRVETGPNALLLVPFDPVVFERTQQIGNLTGVAMAQLAADLLTAPGRAPAEGEELIAWMRGRENDWRVRA